MDGNHSSGRTACPMCDGRKRIVIGNRIILGAMAAEYMPCPFCEGRGAFDANDIKGKAVIAYWGALHLEREAELKRQHDAERRRQELRRAILGKLTEEELAEVATWSKGSA